MGKRERERDWVGVDWWRNNRILISFLEGCRSATPFRANFAVAVSRLRVCRETGWGWDGRREPLAEAEHITYDTNSLSNYAVPKVSSDIKIESSRVCRVLTAPHIHPSKVVELRESRPIIPPFFLPLLRLATLFQEEESFRSFFGQER